MELSCLSTDQEEIAKFKLYPQANESGVMLSAFEQNYHVMLRPFTNLVTLNLTDDVQYDIVLIVANFKFYDTGITNNSLGIACLG